MLKVTLTSASLLLIATQGFAGENSDKALSILKKASATLESAQSLSVNAQATADEIEPSDDFKVQKTFTIDVRLQRPGKLFAAKSGDENVVAYFDGKTFTVVDPLKNRYAQEAVAGTVDDLITNLSRLNVDAPLIDLLQSNLSEIAQKSVLKARYLGVSRIGNQDCEHVVFRTAIADWQLWVAQGQQATLCKSLITTRGLAQAPQYEVTFSDWKIGASLTDTTFEPKIPSGAAQVPFGPDVFRLNF